MEQAGIPREIRLRFRRLPRASRRHTGIISAVRRRNPMSCRCRIQHSIFKNDKCCTNLSHDRIQQIKLLKGKCLLTCL